jgi:hypothetical protein
MDTTRDEPGDLIGVEEASALLEVTRDRVYVMIQEGLLTPVNKTGNPQLQRSEVIAVRELGG